MRVFSAVFSVCLVCVTSSVFSADFYKWTDANGSTHYSNNPPSATAMKGAKNVKQAKAVKKVFIDTFTPPVRTPTYGQPNNDPMYSANTTNTANPTNNGTTAPTDANQNSPQSTPPQTNTTVNPQQPPTVTVVTAPDVKK